MIGVAYFLNDNYIKDELGQRLPAIKTRREFFCREQSITRNEFDVAGRQGIRASLVLVTARVNYDGETEVEYNGQRYSIYRTYSTPYSDDIELYLERKTSNE